LGTRRSKPHLRPKSTRITPAMPSPSASVVRPCCVKFQCPSLSPFATRLIEQERVSHTSCLRSASLQRQGQGKAPTLRRNSNTARSCCCISAASRGSWKMTTPQAPLLLATHKAPASPSELVSDAVASPGQIRQRRARPRVVGSRRMMFWTLPGSAYSPGSTKKGRSLESGLAFCCWELRWTQLRPPALRRAGSLILPIWRIVALRA